MHRSGIALVLVLVGVSTAATVTNTADSGAGSLRQALTDAQNCAGSPHTIAFDVPAGSLTATIDGYTQPGASPNTQDTTQGLDTVLLIEIDGTALPANTVNCLDIGAADTTIRGLVINRCGGAGIRLQSTADGVVIEGNFLGTDPTGMASYSGVPNDLIGGVAPDNVRIGGPTPAARNLLSGGDDKIALGLGSSGPAGLVVQGNLIGTNAAGTAALPNGGAGIDVDDATNAMIGGAFAAARNVISGNIGPGIYVHGDNPATGIVIAGNFIGVVVTGTQALGNISRESTFRRRT